MDEVKIEVRTRQAGDGKDEHFVLISRGKHKMSTGRYAAEHRNRAEFEVDELKHVLLGAPKPNCAAPKYADPEAPPTGL